MPQHHDPVRLRILQGQERRSQIVGALAVIPLNALRDRRDAPRQVPLGGRAVLPEEAQGVFQHVLLQNDLLGGLVAGQAVVRPGRESHQSEDGKKQRHKGEFDTLNGHGRSASFAVRS